MTDEVEAAPVSRLVSVVSAAFAAAGADVVIRAGGENLIRRRRSEERGRAFVVEAEGAGNLVHELVHAALAGARAARGESPDGASSGPSAADVVDETPSSPGTASFRLRVSDAQPKARRRADFHHGLLDDDHGIDYRQIPFSVDDRDGRARLWEELACCLLSCAYLPDPCAIEAWFAEQISIQGVFFGVEGDPVGFVRLVDATRHRFPGELEATIARAAAAVNGWLAAVDSDPPRPRALDFDVLWAGYRQPVIFLARIDAESALVDR